MKKFIAIFAIFAMAEMAVAQNRKIHFEDSTLSFAELKEKAKKENKFIFLDFYTVWCGPCKKMEKEVFVNDSVADFYNEHFICARIDAEKGEGVGLNKKYEIRGYPTFIFLSTDGEVVHRDAGWRYSKEFIQLGTDALDPGKQLSQRINAYYKGKKDSGFVVKILDALDKADLSVEKEKIIDDYLSNNKDKDVAEEIEWRIIKAINNLSSSGKNFQSSKSQYLLRNYDRLLATHGDVVINEKIFHIFSEEIWMIIMGNPPMKSKEDLIADLKSNTRKINPVCGGLLSEIDFLFFLRSDLGYFSANQPRFFSIVDSGIVEKFNWSDWNTLQNVALFSSFTINDTLILKRSIKWIERSIELQRNAYSLYIYARLLFRTGDADKAVVTQQEVIALAKEANDPNWLKFYEDELKRFKH